MTINRVRETILLRLLRKQSPSPGAWRHVLRHFPAKAGTFICGKGQLHNYWKESAHQLIGPSPVLQSENNRGQMACRSISCPAARQIPAEGKQHSRRKRAGWRRAKQLRRQGKGWPLFSITFACDSWPVCASRLFGFEGVTSYRQCCKWLVLTPVQCRK